MKKHVIKKVVASISLLILGMMFGLYIERKNISEKLNKLQILSDKHLKLYLMMCQWMRVKQEGKNIADFLLENGYIKIAIYGMSYVGKYLLCELKNSDVFVKYGIDQRANEMDSDIKIVSPDDFLESVDAVIITPILNTDLIENILSQKLSCQIISLEDILNII